MTDHDFAMLLVKLGNSIQRLQGTELNEEQMNAMSDVDKHFTNVVDGWIAIRERETTS